MVWSLPGEEGRWGKLQLVQARESAQVKACGPGAGQVHVLRFEHRRCGEGRRMRDP